uniref:Ig-like domain-containing protein n=1 Tax=Hippocampus comes TaxID=109280 RepID=A0A3Q3DLJ4_HIPCM
MSWFQTVTQSNRWWFLVQIPAIDTTTMSTTLIGLLLISLPSNPICSHDDQSQDIMLWYRQSKGRRPIELVGGSQVGNEPLYERNDTRLEISRANTQRGSLSIGSVRASDTGVYFCATSTRQLQCEAYMGYEVFFGAGTRLTDKPNAKITLPKVTLFPPSKKECTNEKDRETKKKTLVCAATDFYPDHVSVAWMVDGQKRETGVATDPEARKRGVRYSITSRLRVPADEWSRGSRKFTCVVTFFNGETYVDVPDSISGNDGDYHFVHSKNVFDVDKNTFIRITEDYVVFDVEKFSQVG